MWSRWHAIFDREICFSLVLSKARRRGIDSFSLFVPDQKEKRNWINLLAWNRRRSDTL